MKKLVLGLTIAFAMVAVVGCPAPSAPVLILKADTFKVSGQPDKTGIEVKQFSQILAPGGAVLHGTGATFRSATLSYVLIGHAPVMLEFDSSGKVTIKTAEKSGEEVALLLLLMVLGSPVESGQGGGAWPELLGGGATDWQVTVPMGFPVETVTVSLRTAGGDMVFYLDGPQGDYDGDGLRNWEEESSGTDPTKKDTDGDGSSDKEEIDAGTDPLDPDSKPGGGTVDEVRIFIDSPAVGHRIFQPGDSVVLHAQVSGLKPGYSVKWQIPWVVPGTPLTSGNPVTVTVPTVTGSDYLYAFIVNAEGEQIRSDRIWVQVDPAP